jgi:hypothetical protein
MTSASLFGAMHPPDLPPTSNGDYARRYLVPLMQNGPQKYIRNVHNTQMMIARVEDVVFPVTVTDFHPDNTYTVSPYSHYISYGGFEEVQRLNNPPVEWLIKLLLQPLASYFRRSDFDRAALVNNWLVSTNLYPSITKAQLDVLTEALPIWFPDCAIVFRSVDTFRNPLLFDVLQKQGYEMMLSRQVWYLDPAYGLSLKVHREDMRAICKNGHLQSDKLSDDEIGRCLRLYEMLYLEKYSHFNPQFTEEFIRLAHDEKLLKIITLRRGEKINAVMGYIERNGVMTPPLYGYDTSLPQETALYRHLTVLTMQEAMEKKLLLHDSAGVGKFKKKRGAHSAIEYNAVYTKHLPAWRQRPWKLVKAISKYAIPYFQKNDF